MKAIVKKTFKDKVTGKVCNPGDIIEVSKARYREITAKDDLIEEVTPKTKGKE